MAEPKKRLTSARSGNRRSHLYQRKILLADCPKCHESVISHRACPNCGFYRQNDILKLAQKAKIKEEKRKARVAEEEGGAK